MLINFTRGMTNWYLLNRQAVDPQGLSQQELESFGTPCA
jgi:hypothetical protein